MFFLETYKNIQTAISKNKQDTFIAILLSFFIVCFDYFIFSELPNSIQAVAYSGPYQRIKVEFLVEIVNRGVFQRSI